MSSAFDRIFGQEAAIGAIRRAWAAGRLPHGMIFAGPAGVGKATTARALAELYLCESAVGSGQSAMGGGTESSAGGPPPAACGRCPSCQAFARGAHPDYHIITKELIRYHDKSGKSKGTTLAIEVIRNEVVGPAGLKPAMGHGKVFVIEQAELMQTPAQNALLKTLEEPPGRTLIVLLTAQPHGLLSTVRSRCRTVTFAPLAGELIERELAARGHDHATAAAAARLSEGSLGLGLRWIEDGVVESAGELAGQMRQLRAGRPAGKLPVWLKQAAESYAEKQLVRDPLSSKDQAQREGLSLYLQLAGQEFQQVLRLADDAIELERSCRAIESLLYAEQLLDANVNVNLLLQQLALALERSQR